jgi:hypothetical protein
MTEKVGVGEKVRHSSFKSMEHEQKEGGRLNGW